MQTTKKQSLKKNYLFQFIYQFITLALPLFLVPYLTRKLGDYGLGNYTFLNSIAYYFIIIANLGIEKYGQRVIAKNRNDEELLRKTFWSLFFVHILFSVVAILLYVGHAIASSNIDNNTIVWIELIYVASAMFDITWLFYGLERFNVVVLKSLALKIIEFVLMFCFVKSENDLNTYALIVALFFLLNSVVLLPFALKVVKPIKVGIKDLLPHLKPLLIFTIAIVATTMYTVFDKTLLGIFFEKNNVAYYEYANKIISIPRSFITVTGTIIYPRACSAIENNDLKEQRIYLRVSSVIAAFIGFGSLFGLLGVSKEFAIFYFGDDFAESGTIMMALCSIPLIAGICDIFRAQYLLPLGKEKEYTFCIILNAITNIVFSLIFINVIGIYGVVVGTLISELAGLPFQGFLCRKYLRYRDILIECWPFLLNGMIMFAFLLLLKHLLSGLLFLIVSIAVGFIIYVSLSIAYLLLRRKDFVRLIIRNK